MQAPQTVVQLHFCETGTKSIARLLSFLSIHSGLAPRYASAKEIPVIFHYTWRFEKLRKQRWKLLL